MAGNRAVGHGAYHACAPARKRAWCAHEQEVRLLPSLGALSVAVLLGALLVGLHAGSRRVPWALGVVHGLAGALGLLALTWALWRGAARGPFAWDAGALLALGLLIGLVFATLPAARRHAGGVLAVHAVAAGLGWLLVLGLALG